VVVDDFSRYTWAILFQEKSDGFDAAQHLFKKIQIEQNYQIMRIRNDHGREFENAKFEETFRMGSSRNFPLLSLLNKMEL